MTLSSTEKDKFQQKRQVRRSIKNYVCYIDLLVLLFLWQYLCPVVANQSKFHEDVMHEEDEKGGGEEGFVPLPTYLTYLSHVTPKYIWRNCCVTLLKCFYSYFSYTTHTFFLKPRPLHSPFTWPPPPILFLLYLSILNLCSPSMKRISWLVTIYYWIQYNLQIRIF